MKNALAVNIEIPQETARAAAQRRYQAKQRDAGRPDQARLKTAILNGFSAEFARLQRTGAGKDTAEMKTLERILDAALADLKSDPAVHTQTAQGELGRMLKRRVARISD